MDRKWKIIEIDGEAYLGALEEMENNNYPDDLVRNLNDVIKEKDAQIEKLVFACKTWKKQVEAHGGEYLPIHYQLIEEAIDFATSTQTPPTQEG